MGITFIGIRITTTAIVMVCNAVSVIGDVLDQEFHSVSAASAEYMRKITLHLCKRLQWKYQQQQY